MGNEDLRGSVSRKFEKKLNAAIRSTPGEFSDLVMVSFDGTEHHKNRLGMIIAFPKLRSYLLKHSRLDTFLSSEVIENLDKYAVSGVLTLDNHILELLGVLLELVPIERLQEEITDEVFSHVKSVLSLENIHKTLSVPALAALLFVARIHEMDVRSHTWKWMQSNVREYDHLRDIAEFVVQYFSMKPGEKVTNPLPRISSWSGEEIPGKKFRKLRGKAGEVPRLFFLNADED